MTGLPRNMILIGDVRERLAQLPPGQIDTVITSPPYFQLRDYGVAGQIGLEPNVEGWVQQLRSVFTEVTRVLKPSGSLWLNLGDSYSRHEAYGAPAKALLLAPERLLLALAGDGWIVRNKVIWAKTNPMPSSVTDRLNTTYDVVYFLVRSRRYFFDLNAIRLPHGTGRGRSARNPIGVPPSWSGPLAAGTQDGLRRARADGSPGHVLGKNPGDVWPLAAASFRGAHFATFPEALVERPLLATCPEAICTACGAPWRRAVTLRHLGLVGPADRDPLVRRYAKRWETLRTTGELQPCGCNAATEPGLVLDPFYGAGTVGVVAQKLGRDWLGIELNRDYVDLAERRLRVARGTPGHARAA
jgi:site-specific DNA-methyltransferase (adenine-specific)